MLKLRDIEERNSAFASPIILTPEADHSISFCCYYNKLNEISQTDSFSLPRIDYLIDKISSTLPNLI